MSDTPSGQSNKDILRRYLMMWSGQGEEPGMEELEGIFDRRFDYSEDRALPPTRVSGMGIRGLRLEIAVNREAFPDLEMLVSKHDMVEEGGRVVAFWTIRGTHDGSASLVFGTSREDIEPTGETLTARGATMAGIEEGRIVSMDTIWSPKTLLQQIAERHRSSVPAEPG